MIFSISGPATVRMVSNNGPPLPMPMQVPPGHMVQQIVDEHGILTHVILSPNPPGMPNQPMTVGYYVCIFCFTLSLLFLWSRWLPLECWDIAMLGRPCMLSGMSAWLSCLVLDGWGILYHNYLLKSTNVNDDNPFLFKWSISLFHITRMSLE